MAIATGGMMPRGADAVVMVEHADLVHDNETCGRAVTAGQRRVVRRHRHHRRRDRAAARHDPDQPRHRRACRDRRATVDVWRKPIVAILSTGDEIIAPGQPMQPARVYDSNAQVLADAVRELGGEPRRLGIRADDVRALRAKLREGARVADIVLLSGGTSKGAGDVSYRVVAELTDPGIVAHGVALKPGKPICLAATRRPPGRRAARLPHVRDLHVSRIRRAGDLGDGRRTHEERATGAGATRREREQRDRPHGVPARRPGRARIRTRP